MWKVSSPAFGQGEAIPAEHTCTGIDRSPELAWTKPPDGTRSLALLVDDPDAPDPAAPTRVWVHWIRYNIPPRRESLPEGAGNAPPEDGSLDARTDAGSTGYHGPCPPVGTHRYFFRLFALDTMLPDLGPDADRREFERATAGHVLATAELMGTFLKA
ncbi:MAG TPA: YbhB/YbcL family Raf kinase inhibitor-like protein [Gemmatimonadales bacterium]|nr:YbhB/YbcL family Raf kinase inhibitor-like protein [Gemmatimonadales bacterium]